jgi:acyl-[acyl-carrier-protein]-phospholipid O-acyltransferase / long-chain-fatty-acid--[acyl-carrier-protein] ligase
MLDKYLLRPFFTFLLRLFFRVEVTGREQYFAAGDKVIIIANHQSFLDPFLLAVLTPEKPAFAMNVFQAEKWYFRRLDLLVKIYRLDPSKPMSMKSLIRDVSKGGKVVIFPEGRITTSGGIMKMYDGASLIAEKTGAKILPVRIDGAEYSKLSYISKLVKQRWFPKIRVTFLPPVSSENMTADSMYTLMTQSAFDTADYRKSLLASWIDGYRWHGGGHKLASDITRQWMNYRQLFTRAFILKEKLEGRLNGQSHVAMLLPNALGAMVTFAALHMLGKIPCMLNFSAGPANALHACRIAKVSTVLTSRTFIEKGKLEEVIAALEGAGIAIVYLEDVRPTVTLSDKLKGLWHSFRPADALRGVLAHTNPNNAAVVLYTSGSEGTPKGVVLSHANILANIHQICARVDLMPADMFFNCMPVFHSFGLTAGMLLPMTRGVRTFFYPTPLHYRVIPDMVYDTDATVMLGTDTFYTGYARYAHASDFCRVRLAVAGAEKLKESTRRLWSDKFLVSILEGYGVTETSPVIAVNTPLEHKEGTVGKPLPSIETRLEPVPGLEKGGRLLVKGPNVMLGYLKADQPGVIQPQGEWYDTGDIVDISDDGYISILGRAKRFAKIAGEMVSLTAVEELAGGAMPGVISAAMAVPDPRKGEQVVLYTESKDLTREAVMQHARDKGVPELFLPRQVIYMEAIPKLGTGKIDYVTLGKTAKPAE